MTANACTRECYVAAMSELQVEDDSFDLYTRCEGYDIVAGQLVAKALRDGMDLSQLIEVFAAITREQGSAHKDMRARLEALLVLQLVPLMRELGPASARAAMFVWEDYHHDPLAAMASISAGLACRMVEGESPTLRHIILQAREFVRSAQELGGLQAVRAVVGSLQAKLEFATTGRP